jgi:hypothetical protein
VRQPYLSLQKRAANNKIESSSNDHEIRWTLTIGTIHRRIVGFLQLDFPTPAFAIVDTAGSGIHACFRSDFVLDGLRDACEANMVDSVGGVRESAEELRRAMRFGIAAASPAKVVRP